MTDLGFGWHWVPGAVGGRAWNVCGAMDRSLGRRDEGIGLAWLGCLFALGANRSSCRYLKMVATKSAKGKNAPKSAYTSIPTSYIEADKGLVDL